MRLDLLTSRRSASPALLLASLLLVLAAPAGAHAHQLTVLPAGSAQLDLGTVSQARLLHVTLEQPSDALEVGVRVDATPLEALLLVPDVTPERDARGAELPTARGADFAPVTERTVLTDESTGVRYRVAAEVQLLPRSAARGPRTLTIARGDEPTRAALLVRDPDAPFAALDLERTPRALLGVRAWQDTPAAGAKVPPRPEPTGSTALAWYAAGLALLATLTAIWWIRSGRASARARGVERELGGR